MNKIFLETKIAIEGSLNLKNLSQVNNPEFNINDLNLKPFKPIFNEHGKVMKGPNYFKPDLSKFVY